MTSNRIRMESLRPRTMGEVSYDDLPREVRDFLKYFPAELEVADAGPWLRVPQEVREQVFAMMRAKFRLETGKTYGDDHPEAATPAQVDVAVQKIIDQIRSIERGERP